MTADVIALNRGGFYAERLKESGVPVTTLGKRFRFDPLTCMRLKSCLHESQPDVIQSYLFAANSYVRLPGVAPQKSRVVVAERCVDSWKSGWQLAVDRRLKGRMHRMTANSESVARFYHDTVGVPNDLIEVIPNGAWTDDREVNSPDLREELGLPAEARIVGFVGRLAAQKRLKDLVWAFHLLQSAIDNVFLVLVGDGPERQSTADFAQSLGCRSKVFFTGHSAEAEYLIRQFNVFCLPSAFEGMSNSLMEALSCGVPSVVSDIPANQELVRNEETGLVFPLGQGPDLAKAIKRFLEDPELGQKLAKNARELIDRQHSVRQMVDRYVALYQQL